MDWFKQRSKHFRWKQLVIYSITKMGLDPFIGSSIRDIRVDANGLIWVFHSQVFHDQIMTARGGFTKFDGTKWSEITFSIIQNNEIISTNVDSDNRKWLSTSNGLGLFTQPGDIKKIINLDTTIPCTNIYSSCMDNIGDVWFVTLGNGMAKIEFSDFNHCFIY